MGRDNPMLTISPSLPSERADIERVTHAAGNFHGEELSTPLELFDGYVRDPKASGYNFLSARLDGVVVGFACYGPTPLTEATYDLYWIVTEAASQRRGVGRRLFESTIAIIKDEGGRLLMIWTSGTPEYEQARAFYVRMGCHLEARIKNFYRHHDDLCIFSFRLDGRSKASTGPSV
jgi:ribosomal protein S18 acetylase RimI-like enzyme